MLQPARTKWRKQRKGRMRGTALRGSAISFGEIGLQAVECGWLTSRQIEAARIALTREIKRGGKVWIRVFPDKPVTSKPAETRMGTGKGAVSGYVAVVKPGRMLYEVQGVDEEVALAALRLAAFKLPIRTKVVRRESTEL